MQKPITQEINFANRTLSFETGILAPKANASVLVRCGDTVVLVTATSGPPDPDDDGLPLRVDYEERLYAGGIIKGSRFVKREGKPSDESILGGRLIDRSIRPLFPKGFNHQVQIIAIVLSVDGENDPQWLSLIGASAALTISDIPWNGPIGAVMVGKNGDAFEINLNSKDLENSPLELLVSSSRDRVVMIEARGHEVPEAEMVEAIKYAGKEIQPLINFIEEFKQKVGKEKCSFEPAMPRDELCLLIEPEVQQKIETYLKDNYENDTVYQSIVDEMVEKHSEEYPKWEVGLAVSNIRKKLIREGILQKQTRIDGRSLTDIREISLSVGTLPRTHGSALFQRGQTQVMTVTTLGSAALEQLIEGMEGEETKRYLHHYNAASFSSGEVKPNRGPGRREIGHGALAEKALFAVIPDREKFPYTIRVVSEVLSQNGSSSMAASCGSSLSLMDAGVPIKSHVAGISIGLIENTPDNYLLLTDIRGLEDINGDMDFKVAGTRKGITAIQLDVKNQGLTYEMYQGAIESARIAREVILEQMEKVIAAPRESLSSYAPRVDTLSIDREKIGEVIGSGGRTIKGLMQETDTEINIEDDGTVTVSGTSEESVKKAINMIEGIVREVEVGEVYTGKVTRIMDFGAFVEVLPGKEGLVHISQLAFEHVNRVEDVLKVGDEVQVKVIEVDSMGRINLSVKALKEAPPSYQEPSTGNRSGGDFRRKPPFKRGGYNGQARHRNSDHNGPRDFNKSYRPF